MSVHSLQNLKRWSCADRDLPSIDSIKAIHVYDFDNTLFKTPLPNAQIWYGANIGTLQTESQFHGGGWWHNPGFLAAVGEGVDKEEPRGWAGWWNETIVDLVRLSMEQSSALTVLLTGRSEGRFGELIQRMVKAKGLEFDMVGLKPIAGPSNEKFSSTMQFKQAFLTKLVQTYSHAEEMKIYEDRPKHVTAFETFCADINRQRDPTNGEQMVQFEVVPVAEGATVLDPLAETVEVQKMINEHNAFVNSENAPPGAIGWFIKRQTLYSGYLIDPADSERLPAVAGLTPSVIKKDHLRTLSNNVMITPRPLTDTVKDKVGGLGAKVRWKVVGLGVYDNKVWAARVEPVPVTAKFYVESAVPHVVLARRQDARPADASRITQWSPIPPEKHIEFDTIVGEKVLLRLDQQKAVRRISAPRPQHKSLKRPPPQDEYPALPKPPQQNENRYAPLGPPSQQGNRGGHFNRGGRGGGRGGRGGQRGTSGGGGGGRGNRKNGPPAYRSLDDQTNKRSMGMDGANDDGGLTY